MLLIFFSLLFVSDPNRINGSFGQINEEPVNYDSNFDEVHPNTNENDDNDDDHVQVLVQLDENDVSAEVDIYDHGLALVKHVLEANETSSSSESAEILKAIKNCKISSSC